MSFIGETIKGLGYNPDWFLVDDETAMRETRQISATGAKTAANGGKYVPMGTIYPSNDANAIGILYEDVDVGTGDMPGSVVTCGKVYKDRLPVALSTAAETALAAKGFVFSTSPKVTRP